MHFKTNAKATWKVGKRPKPKSQMKENNEIDKCRQLIKVHMRPSTWHDHIFYSRFVRNWSDSILSGVGKKTVQLRNPDFGYELQVKVDG